MSTTRRRRGENLFENLQLLESTASTDIEELAWRDTLFGLLVTEAKKYETRSRLQRECGVYTFGLGFSHCEKEETQADDKCRSFSPARPPSYQQHPR